MALPWLTVGKLVLNNLDSIIGVMRPALTRKKIEAVANQADIVNQQIAELQTAAATNADQIKELAEQLKNVVTALDDAARTVAIERAKTRRLALAAIGLAILAIAVAVGSVFLK
jgi:chromosome segregation ATPase